MYDYIIVGQGIAGTMLSYFLQEAGMRVLVYDDVEFNSASRVAAGIINPVSGRRFELAWMYDTVYAEAIAAYQEIERLTGDQIFVERDIWNVWPSAQMRDAFAVNQHPGYTALPAGMRYTETLLQPFGAGIVRGANVRLHVLLPAWRQLLEKEGCFRSERLLVEALELNEHGVFYQDVSAKAVIFCEGAASPSNPWFSKLRFLPNKGEVLLVRIPALRTNDIIKKGITLVPLEDDLYWAGASYSWDYTDASPTSAMRAKLEEDLRQLLKVPFSVEKHIAAIRPSGPDRRPLAGMHPLHPQVGIFNGMGSKGCSLAPWAARHMTRRLLESAPLPREIDIQRHFNALR